MTLFVNEIPPCHKVWSTIQEVSPLHVTFFVYVCRHSTAGLAGSSPDHVQILLSMAAYHTEETFSKVWYLEIKNADAFQKVSHTLSWDLLWCWSFLTYWKTCISDIGMWMSETAPLQPYQYTMTEVSATKFQKLNLVNFLLNYDMTISFIHYFAFFLCLLTLFKSVCCHNTWMKTWIWWSISIKR